MVVFELADLPVCWLSTLLFCFFPFRILFTLNVLVLLIGRSFGRPAPVVNRPNFQYGRPSRGQFNEPVGPYGN